MMAANFPLVIFPMHRPPRKRRPGGGQDEGPSEAEFRRDWAALQKRLAHLNEEPPPEPEEDDDAENDEWAARSLADAEVLSTFARKHRRRLLARGIDVDEWLAQGNKAVGELQRATKVLDDATEKLLQARADKAETEAKAIEHIYAAWRFYESRTQEDWDRQTPELKKEMTELLEQLRQDMPAYLEQLPIERRRALEASERPWEPPSDKKEEEDDAASGSSSG